MESIFKAIEEASEKLLKEQIRANMVVIDRKYIGALKPFIVHIGDEPCIAQPMIGGLKMFFDVLPEDTAFIVMHSDNLPVSENERLRAENEDLRRKLKQIEHILEPNGGAYDD